MTDGWLSEGMCYLICAGVQLPHNEMCIQTPLLVSGACLVRRENEANGSQRISGITERRIRKMPLRMQSDPDCQV